LIYDKSFISKVYAIYLKYLAKRRYKKPELMWNKELQGFARRMAEKQPALSG
jgi:hypothetical protein